MSEESRDNDIVGIIDEIKRFLDFESIKRIFTGKLMTEKNWKRLLEDTIKCRNTTGVAEHFVGYLQSFVKQMLDKTLDATEKSTLEMLEKFSRGALSVARELKSAFDAIGTTRDSYSIGFYEKALHMRNLSAAVFVLAQEVAKISVIKNVTEYVSVKLNNGVAPPFDEVEVLGQVEDKANPVMGVKESMNSLLIFQKFYDDECKGKTDDEIYKNLYNFLKRTSNDESSEEKTHFVAGRYFGFLTGVNKVEKELQTKIIKILQTDIKQEKATAIFVAALDGAKDIYNMVRTFETATDEKKDDDINKGRDSVQRNYFKVTEAMYLLAGTVYDDGQVVKLGDQVDDFIEKFLKSYLLAPDKGDDDMSNAMKLLEYYASRLQKIKDEEYVQNKNRITLFQMHADLETITKVRDEFMRQYDVLKAMREGNKNHPVINAKFMEANKLCINFYRNWSILIAFFQNKLGINKRKNSSSIASKDVTERIKEVDDLRRSLEEKRTPSLFQRLLRGKSKEVAGEAVEPKPVFWTRGKKVFIFVVICIAVLAAVGFVIYNKIRFNQLLVWPPGSNPSTPPAPSKTDPGQPKFSISKTGNTIAVVNNARFTPVALENTDGTFVFGSGGFYMSTDDSVLANCFTTAVPSFPAVSVDVTNYSEFYDIQLTEFAIAGFCIVSVNDEVKFSFPQNYNGAYLHPIYSMEAGTTVGSPIIFKDSSSVVINDVGTLGGTTFYTAENFSGLDVTKSVNTITFQLGFVGSGQIYFKLSAIKKTT